MGYTLHFADFILSDHILSIELFVLAYRIRMSDSNNAS